MKPRFLLILGIFTALACKPVFNPGAFGSTDELYKAAMTEYEARRWENAAKAFERLTTELSPRDPRVTTAYMYLGRAQERRGDHLLAAKSYSRVYELMPQDTLADDALLASGLAYAKMWRRPALDSEYGENALTQFQTLKSLYPDSPVTPEVDAQITKLDEWFATKDYETGYHYLKRKAYDSAIIYFKDVIRLHPQAKKTREAYLRLHDAYQAINYRDDARDLCVEMRKAYPEDRDVSRACGPAPAATASQ
ncbi:MAG: outer membrane protein assembly factor BamD [Gemmatimonadaceae bacterium]